MSQLEAEKDVLRDPKVFNLPKSIVSFPQIFERFGIDTYERKTFFASCNTLPALFCYRFLLMNYWGGSHYFVVPISGSNNPFIAWGGEAIRKLNGIFLPLIPLKPMSVCVHAVPIWRLIMASA